MNRASQLLALRPELTSLSAEAQPKSLETFQNEVLRPILKFQNALTLALLKNHPHFSFSITEKDKLNTHIKTVSNETRFKNQLIGLVVGLMTVEEFHQYSQDFKEYNKRILTMQVERYVDQLDSFIS